MEGHEMNWAWFNTGTEECLMPDAVESRVTVVETRLESLMETLANQLSTMNTRMGSVQHSLNERLNDLRAWLIALTTLAGVQFATMLTLAIVVLRR